MRRVRRLVVAAATLLGLIAILARPVAASAETETTTLKEAEISSALFVAGDIERLSKVRHGTEELILEKALQQMYADNSELEPGTAKTYIDQMKELLASESAPTQASLQLMAGNQRIIAILTALESPYGPAKEPNKLPPEAKLAVTHLAAVALASSSDIFANAEIPKYFEPLVDERSNLTFGAFAPATVLRATYHLASENESFAIARDAIWGGKEASEESVKSKWKELFAESKKVLDASALASLRTEIEAGKGELKNVALSTFTTYFTKGQNATKEQACAHGGVEEPLGEKRIPGVPVPTCSGGSDYEVTHDFQHGFCDKAKACEEGVEKEHEALETNAEHEAKVIAEENALMAAAGELMRPADVKAAELDQATDEAQTKITEEETAYSKYQAEQAEAKEIENIIKVGVTGGSAVASFCTGDISGGIAGLFNTGLEIYSLIEEQKPAPPGPQEIALEDMNDLRKQLGEFQQFTQAAFEALNTQVAQLSARMAQENYELELKLGTLAEKIDAVQESLTKEQVTVFALQNELQNLFSEQVKAELHTTIEESVGWLARTGEVLSPTRFQESLVALKKYATEVANGAEANPKTQPYTYEGAEHQLTGEPTGELREPGEAILYLATFPAEQRPVWVPATAPTMLPNTTFWSEGARAYAQLLQENSSHASGSDIANLKALENEGLLLESAEAPWSAKSGSGKSESGNAILDEALAHVEKAASGSGVNEKKSVTKQLEGAAEESFNLNLEKGTLVKGNPTKVNLWGGPKQTFSSFAVATADLPALKWTECSGSEGNIKEEQMPEGFIGSLPAVVVNGARLGIIGPPESKDDVELSVCRMFYDKHDEVGERAHIKFNVLLKNEVPEGGIGACPGDDCALPANLADGYADYSNEEYAVYPPEESPIAKVESELEDAVLSGEATLQAQAYEQDLTELNKEGEPAANLGGARGLVQAYVRAGLPQALESNPVLQEEIEGVGAQFVDPELATPRSVGEQLRALLNGRIKHLEEADGAIAALNKYEIAKNDFERAEKSYKERKHTLEVDGPGAFDINEIDFEVARAIYEGEKATYEAAKKAYENGFTLEELTALMEREPSKEVAERASAWTHAIANQAKLYVENTAEAFPESKGESVSEQSPLVESTINRLKLTRFVLDEAKAPKGETIAPTDVGKTEATLHGEVDPNGGAVESCEFEYGSTEAYGETAECTPSPPLDKLTIVSAKVTKWTPEGSFHYRVVIRTWGGTAYGQDVKVQLEQSAGGPAVPSVVTTGVTGLGPRSATVEGTVNPHGEAVAMCEFTVERLSGGLPTGEKKTVPCASGPGSGTEPVVVKALVTELLVGTTYRFSLTASNESGTATSEPPSEFTTLATSFEVVKEQRLAGEKSYTTAKLASKAPATVEYEIVVKNTGSATIEVGEVIDANAPGCEGAAKQGDLAPGEEAVEATCSIEYVSFGVFKNVAEVLTSESKGESNEVEVELEQVSAFEVVKEQRFAGESAYTTAKLVGKAPDTVEYEIVVKNTGDTTLEVGEILDTNAPGCKGVAKLRKLAPGEEAVEATCSMEYKTVGAFKNVAVVFTSGGKGESNEVEAVLEGGTTGFELIKEQRFAGEKAFTKSKLVGKAPATVEYEIVVKNTGGTTLDVEEVGDAQVPACDEVAKQPHLAPGEEAVEATCSAEYKAAGNFKNAASVLFTTAEGFTNEVEVELEPVTSFEVLKEQRFEGAGSYTTGKLTGTLPATLEYEIVVRNTGETTIEVLKLLDANAPGCQTTPAKPKVEPGQEAVEATCTVEHKTAGVFKNVAFVVTSGREERSNEVEAELSESAIETFEIVKEQKLAGQPTFTKSKLSASVGGTVDYRIVVTNTGNVTEKFVAFSDHNCTNIAGGASELRAGESATWTCEHVLTASGVYVNEASVEKIGPPGKDEASNKVEVEVRERTTAFEVIKEQRFAGESAYTTAKLAGKAPATVEYEIIVKNTGETAIEVLKLQDANAPGCEKAPAKVKLLAGEEAVEASCAVEQKTAGVFKNRALVVAGGREEFSNEVEAELSEPSIETFEIVKEQKLAGQPTFTKSKLTASVGETVDYRVVVTNTGDVTEHFTGFSDPNCTNIAGGTSELKRGESATWTCEHTLTASGVYVNEATIENAISDKRSASNKVEVEVKEHGKETLVVEKEQRIGSGAFTKKKLKGTAGEVVDYQITVRNTGETVITLAKIIDAGCSNMSPPGKATLAPGESTTYGCEHVLAEGGTYTNVAEVETGGGTTGKSNTVGVRVTEGKVCAVESLHSFVDQGEGEEASSVADVIHIGCLPSFAERTVRLSDNELFSNCANNLSWAAASQPAARVEGPSFEVELDDDGNATVALWGGPSCAAGSTLITADLLVPPYTTVAAEFAVLPPKATEPGLKAQPAKEIEDATYSTVATIVEVEFPAVDGGQYVRVGAEQLAASCLAAPHLMWIGADEKILGGTELVEEVEEAKSQVLKLDNDGNAFVVLFGDRSCAAERSEIEATLMTPPYTTRVTNFTVESPHPTIKAKK